MSFLQNLKHELQKQNKLTLIIIINLVLFLILNLESNLSTANFRLINLFQLPIHVAEFLTHFWTIVTYMFVHINFGHVFYNMLLLYFNGRIFANLLTEKRLVFTYLLSGICGGLLLIMLGLLFPHNFSGSYLFGSSAAVLGVISALAIYTPNLPVSIWGIFEIKYKYLALLIFVVMTILDFAINTGGKISHFGGAFFGLFFGYMLKNGKDISSLSFYKKTKKSNLKVVHTNTSNKSQSPNSDNQQTIDMLLDKISKNGYENLSTAEKELLFKLSKKK